MKRQDEYNFEIKKIFLNNQGGNEVYLENVTDITALTLTKMAHDFKESKSNDKKLRCWIYTHEGMERLRKFIKAMTGKDLVTDYYLTVV